MLALRRAALLWRRAPAAVTSYRSYTSDEKETASSMLMSAVSNLAMAQTRDKLGPEHACAEWLIGHGAWIRWKGEDTYVTAMDQLPYHSQSIGTSALARTVIPKEHLELLRGRNEERLGVRQYIIEEVYADECKIMWRGFDAFKGCVGVKKLVFLNCPFLNDGCLQKLQSFGELSESLEHLEIICNDEVTSAGLSLLIDFINLKHLKLIDLPNIMGSEVLMRCLRGHLPECDIEIRLLGHRS